MLQQNPNMLIAANFPIGSSKKFLWVRLSGQNRAEGYVQKLNWKIYQILYVYYESTHTKPFPVTLILDLKHVSPSRLI